MEALFLKKDGVPAYAIGHTKAIKHEGPQGPVTADEMFGLFEQGLKDLQMESGSNDDGSWVRLPDGTIICTYQFNGVVDANGTLVFDWAYPIPFQSRPFVAINKKVTTNNIDIIDVGINRSRNDNTYVSAIFKNSYSGSTSVYSDIIAVGR